MKIIRTSWFPPGGIKLINLFGYIFAKTKTKISQTDWNHEYTHTKQIADLFGKKLGETAFGLIVGGLIYFYPLYLIFFIVGLIKYMNWDNAYNYIPFEAEAYANEDDDDYNANRDRWAWTSYL